VGHDRGRGGPDARHITSTPRRRSRRGRLQVVLAAVMLLLVAWAVALVVGATQARAELVSASGLVTTLQDKVLEGDRMGAAATLGALQAHSAAAREATSGLHWRVAARIPWVGPNIEAARVVAEVVDDLSTSALPALMQATEVVDPAALVPVDGRVDVAALQEAAPTVVAAAAVVSDALARLDALETEQLWSAVAGPLAMVRTEVAAVDATTATAARAVQLLPPMLGADGPRSYLLLVQNNAEVRATGGIPGSVILLQVADGVVQIVDHRSAGSLGDLAAPALPLTDTEMSLFGADLAADMRYVTFTPDFPRSAEIARAIWAQQVGGEVDGVVSVDPGALALLLDDTGPVPLPAGAVSDAVGGQLTAENAVTVLLNTVYLLTPDPAVQDAFFAETASSALTALLAGQGEPAAAVDALAEAARQGRLMVWSAHAEEQALLDDTVLGGRLRGDAGGSPVIGVFLNDGSQAKMSFYLETSIAVEQQDCLPDGSRTFDVGITLANTVPPDVAALPAYVTGGGAVVPVGEVRTNVLIYAPTDGRVEGVQVEGQDPGVTSQIHDGLAVVGRTTQLAPGASVTIHAQVTTGARFLGPLLLRSTPVAKGETSVPVMPSCS